MKLGQITESEVFNTKVDILLDRISSVPELDTKLQWIIAYGGRDNSRKAQGVYQKIYGKPYRPDLRKRSAIGNILRVNDIWRDINDSWFLRDLEPLIPDTWKNGQDPIGQRLLALVAQESGPGDDSGLQVALATILNKLLTTPARDKVGPLVSKHILSEIFA